MNVLLKSPSGVDILWAMDDVHIQTCGSYDPGEAFEAMKALMLGTGLDLPGDMTVFIKPNLMSQNRPEQHTVTHYSLVAALCRLLRERKCRIRIGDSIAFYESGLTRRAFVTARLREVADEYGAELVPLDEERLVKVEPKRSVLRELFLPRAVLEADAVINFCKLKTHAGLRLSGALKNIFGVLPGGYKQRIHSWTDGDFGLSDVFLDLHEIIRPKISIMDAVYALDGGPSAMGKPVFLGMILASEKAAPLDMVAGSLIGYGPDDVSTLIRARERGMTGDIGSIRVFFNGNRTEIGKLPRKKLRSLIQGPISVEKKGDGILVTGTFVQPYIVRSGCNGCGECVAFCTPGAISMTEQGVAEISEDTCINCYACIAACPMKAVDIRSSLVNKSIRLMRSVLGI